MECEICGSKIYTRTLKTCVDPRDCHTTLHLRGVKHNKKLCYFCVLEALVQEYSSSEVPFQIPLLRLMKRSVKQLEEFIDNKTLEVLK